MLANSRIFKPVSNVTFTNNTENDLGNMPWTKPSSTPRKDAQEAAKNIFGKLESQYLGNSFKAVSDGFEKTDEGDYQLYFRLAGYEKDEVGIKLKNDKMTITARDDGDYVGKQNVVKQFTVPDWVDVENISAKMNNGMLQITLPKDSGGGEELKIDIE
jgi:HSP20 family molecular chaperone IbpA